MDRLDSMRVFLRVAETGSFTKAADLLDMPRATVSAAVQQLEAQLGSRLLHRTTRQVQLTHDGSVVLERCRHLLEDMEELESLFHDGSRASGRLKVDVPSRVARLLIAPALPEFFRQHPDIELELGSSDRSVDLVQEGVDCVLRVGQLGNSSLVARRLGEMQLINCASPAYLEEHGEPRTPADLDRHWAVNYASPSSGRVLPWEYREDGRTLTRALRSRVTVNNAESYIACCLSGLGLIQIPAYDVREQAASVAAGQGIRRLAGATAPRPPLVHDVHLPGAFRATANGRILRQCAPFSIRRERAHVRLPVPHHRRPGFPLP